MLYKVSPEINFGPREISESPPFINKNMLKNNNKGLFLISWAVSFEHLRREL